MDLTPDDEGTEHRVAISAAAARLDGELEVPEGAHGLVVFPHAAGIGRGPRDSFLAHRVRDAGLGTLLLNLLSDEEEQLDARLACFRFDIALLAKRLVAATGWLTGQPATRGLGIGYFGFGTAAAAALTAAARLDDIGAVVAYDGRIDLAERCLGRVVAPTLLLVSTTDQTLIGINRARVGQFRGGDCPLVLVAGADQYGDASRALDEVARLTLGWFAARLQQPPVPVFTASTLS